jgi:16S rRNA G966 N2-methylase RsmD
MKNKRTAIDLFAGCGGFSLGVKQAGFKVVLAVENDKWACDTYHRNHKDTFLICDDIKNVTGERIFNITKLRKYELDFLFGGPPHGLVYDPFCGTGTTCAVAKELGRNYIGNDLKKEYVNMSKERLR